MSNAPRQMALQVSLDDSATFANFFVAQANRQSVAYLSGSAGTELEFFTYLWGGVGAGTSHLLQAVCHDADARGQACFYLPLAQAADYSPDVLEGLECFPLVCLDDLEVIAGQDAWEGALFTLFNRLRESGSRLLVAAHCSPRELPVQLPDLLSRLQSGVVFSLQVPGDEEKREALQLRARQRGIELSDEVLSYVLQRNERSMRGLFSLLERLDQFSLQTQRRITVPLVRELMEQASAD
ncbi:MAG: DnaA regulatory inactivator Hda [Pseudomonadales bacterium]|nr:DnaA regulatory inactivator Hda [Pseudomonadales bacterium]MCP5331386.1 DnaA regulatory inactivator Hda [Pseudomonadales bacterium]MCP5344395.1 DnaA regulatory inactivator Hda [Pseudomonadales bacterium]